MKTDLFQSCGHCWVFQICWYIEWSTLTGLSFRIWNSSAWIPSPPLTLFIVMLPEAHLTSHSRMSGSRWGTTPSWLFRSIRPLLYSSSVYSCHLFLVSSCVRSLPFLSFIVPILAWNIPLISPIFLKRSLVIPILLFSSIPFIILLRSPSYLSLLFSGTLFSWVHISLSPLSFTSLFFSAICKGSSDKHFAFLHYFCFGMVLLTASCTLLWTSVNSSWGTLSTKSNPLNLFVTSTV